VISFFLALALLLSVQAGDGTLPFPLPHAGAVGKAPTFEGGDRIVATHYFYWYRWPDSHCDQLRLHFPEEKKVSFESEDWHRGELEAMVSAGIDVALPVYWGCVDHYDRPGVSFSVKGLPPLVRALDAMAAAGRKAPRIGLFYDTSTLLNGVRGALPAEGRADLRTEEGRDVFYRTIRDFFCQVPPRHWACIDGKPLVVLYSSAFAAGFDQGAFDAVSERFRSDFSGVAPFVIRDASWGGVETDGVCSWGAALQGARLGDGTVQIGPGYDDSPVHGRRTPIREREDGRFYEKAWRMALRSGRDIVIVETWNEHHEGTSIAPTREFGGQYVEITRRYADLFRARRVVKEEITLEFPALRPRPDRSWGREAEGKREVRFVAGGESSGLRPKRHEDGPFVERRSDVGDGVGSGAAGAGRHVVATAGAGPGKVSYLYFQVSDWFFFDGTGEFALDVEWRSAGTATATVQYDSRNRAATLEGAYTSGGRFRATGPGKWHTERLPLREARFANRQNGGCDFRFAVTGADIEVRRVELKRRD
jgi:hypothetical protein